MVEREAYCLGKPLKVGNEPVLLIDDAVVEDRWGVYRHMNVPIKFPGNPILMSDQPWEKFASLPSVIYDEEAKKFIMWYVGHDWSAYQHQYDWKDWKPEHGYPYYVCYAESPDGMHWEKPRIPGRPYGEFPATNVVLTGRQKAQGSWVMPNHPSTGQPGKYMMCYRDNLPDAHSSLCLSYSDDGIDWREDPANPIIRGIRDTRNNMVFDPLRERWLYYTRPMCFAGKDIEGKIGHENWKRRGAVSIGDTPQSFGYPRCILWPDEHDHPDYDDFLVNRVGVYFIAMVTHMSDPPERNTLGYLAFSYDGLKWDRLPDRVPFIGLGKEGEFDAGQAGSVGPFVNVGDRTYFYYYGTVLGQGARENLSAIGVAQIKKNRFVAQMGKHTGGFLLTREFEVEGRELVVNVTLADSHNAAKYGSVKMEDQKERDFSVELVGAPTGAGEPAPIPGYTFQDCTASPTDSVNYLVKWKNNPDLSPLVGKSVFIRFFLKNTGIYSFQIRK